MYGIILVIIEDLVIEKFGPEAWDAVKDVAGCKEIPNGGFIRHEHYKDDITLRLVNAACYVSGLPIGTVWETFGEYFVAWMMDHGYRSLLRSQGTTLFDFLNSLNDMHRGLQRGMPRLVPPRIVCSSTGENLVVEYVSERNGLGDMIPGMIRGVGHHIFSKRYTCSVIKKWSAGEKSHVLYNVHLEGESEEKITGNVGLVQRLGNRIIRGFTGNGEHDGYAFFDQNPSMCAGWVKILQASVRRIKTVADAKVFAESFDLRHLASLLTTSSSEALVALSTLFLEPLAHPDGLVPIPSLAYNSGPSGLEGIRAAMIGSVSMCAQATLGRNCLVQTTPRRGLRLTPVRVKVFVVPKPFTDGILIRALADTQNAALLNSVEVWGIVTAAWGRVYPRFALTLAVDVGAVILITCVLCPMPFDTFCVEVALLKCAFLKELLEQILVLFGHVRRSWLTHYATGAHFFQLVSLLLFFNFLSLSDSRGCVDAVAHGGAFAALFAFSRWLQLLYDLRVLVRFGPILLPIIYTWQSVPAVLIVVCIVLMGFVYAFAILQQTTLGLDTVNTVMVLLFDMQGDEAIVFDAPGMHVWRFVFCLVIVFWLLNLSIGVLSDSYRAHSDAAISIFNRERLHVILDLEMCLWPCKRLYPCLHTLQALFCIEDTVRHQHPTKYTSLPQKPDVEVYLWLCVHGVPPENGCTSTSANESSPESVAIDTWVRSRMQKHSQHFQTDTENEPSVAFSSEQQEPLLYSGRHSL